MVNTEHSNGYPEISDNYNILNIVVNTELKALVILGAFYYNILNIVVNTEQEVYYVFKTIDYNILNIVVNTEQT